MSYDKIQVKEALSIDDVFDILDSLGAEPEMHDGYITALTVCHGGDSHKLYYFDNTQLCRCFTHCGNFDIFELIQKVKGLDLNAAIYYVVNFFNLQYKLDEIDDTLLQEDWKIMRRWQELAAIKVNHDKITLPEIDKGVLRYYPQPRILDWEQEYIPKEVSDFMDIHYDPVNGAILIPHTDENNRLIGIRERTLVQENEKYGKYRPWRRGDIQYNHPLAFNLYGFYQAKDNIKNLGIAIIVESEKSVLQVINYLGLANNIAVAVCGSSISKYQFQMLLDAGAKEICIAFDSDYNQIGDSDWRNCVERLQRIYNKYSPYASISYMFDTSGKKLGYKQSPTDCGQDIFMELWKDRIFL